MRRFLSKRALGLSFVVLLALFLFRPPLGLMQRRVVRSLGIELGRPVEMSSVHLRFLPRPGLELEGFTIYDTQFGAEPLLRAAHVVAWVRLSSLLRARLEISSLSLAEVSLNLSRNAEGQWNIERLLERASQSSTAPTASSRKEARREFPYIEADQARINFKNGPEKTHYALTQAEFALWQASEDDWGMRLRATPIRTDANLTDTGVVRAEGTWHRSRELRNTPFEFSLEWKEAQLGQLSKLVWGADQGWRGGFVVNGKFAGTPGHFKLTADLMVDQLRRQDILSGGDLQLATHCAAEYNRDAAALSHLDCGAAFGDGAIELKGTASVPFPSAYDLTLAVKEVPAESVLELARQVNQAIPPDLHALGTINMVLSRSRRAAGRPQSRGEGELVGLKLSSTRSASELVIPTVPVKLEMSSSDAGSREAGGRVPEFQLGPMDVDAGRPMPLRAQLAVSRAGYRASIRGEAAIERLEQAAAMFRIGMPQAPAEGSASVNLALSRQWSDRTPAINGTAQLHALRAQVRGLNSPLEIRRADLAIRTDSVRVTNVDASAGETTWRGSLEIPRPCALPDSCALEFRLHSPKASAAGFNQLFNPRAAKHPWYRLLRLGSSGSFFARITASGSVAIDKLALGGAVADHFSGDLRLDHGRVSLTNVRSSFLGGRATGSMRADFSESPPAYSGSGSLDGMSLEAVSALLGKSWAQGSASAAYGFQSSGWNIADVVDAAELEGSFKVQDGTFPHIVLRAGADPLHASWFSGQVNLKRGQLFFKNAELASSGSVFTVTGTASLAGALKLTMTGENSGGYALSGTLDETRVRSIPGPPTQAALKP